MHHYCFFLNGPFPAITVWICITTKFETTVFRKNAEIWPSTGQHKKAFSDKRQSLSKF